jgi:hypothetical protein
MGFRVGVRGWSGVRSATRLVKLKEMMMSEYAEELPYFRTGNSSPDTWIAKAVMQIEKAGGMLTSEGYGSSNGKSAYMIRFVIDAKSYRIVWPVAESKYTDEPKGFAVAARRQAATMLFHDAKAMCVKARALGSEVAFFSHLELDDGRVASELVGASGNLPKLLGGAK